MHWDDPSYLLLLWLLPVVAGILIYAYRKRLAAAKTFVERLGALVLAVPGNHDIALFDPWARLARPYARWAEVFGADLEPVHASAELLVVGVNTTRAWRHKHGEVSAAQIGVPT